MASGSSFDIVSEVNLQEVDNAVNQARKEIGQRYDFKGARASIDVNTKEKTVTIEADDDFKVRSVVDVLQGKLVKRGVPLKALAYGAVEPASGGRARQLITLRVGIDRDNARLLVKRIKETGLKVQAQIMEDQVRVSGKSKDDLQAVIAALKAADLEFAIQFTNYR